MVQLYKCTYWPHTLWAFESRNQLLKLTWSLNNHFSAFSAHPFILFFFSKHSQHSEWSFGSHFSAASSNCVWFNSVPTSVNWLLLLLVCSSGIQWSFINNSLQSQNSSRSAKGSSSLDRLYSRKIRKQLVHHKQVNVSHSNTNAPSDPDSQMCSFK